MPLPDRARVSSRQLPRGRAYKPLETFSSDTQFRGLVLAGFESREFATSRLISRQVISSVYVGENVSDFTQLMRSAAGNVDQFLLSSSRVRCSLARQLCNLSLGVWLYATEAAARQLAVTSQLGTLSAATAA